MNKITGEYYYLIVFTVWVVGVPMAVKDAYGFVPSLCAAVVSSLLALGIVRATLQKSKTTKLVVMLASVVMTVTLMALLVKREKPTRNSETTVQAE